MKTYKDIYTFPLKDTSGIGYIYDKNNNFVFQFTFDNDELQRKLLDVINEEDTLKNKDLTFRHLCGSILDNNDNSIILIRGWGNLTGTGSFNLSAEDAINVQDTFAEYIVEQLNKRI